MERSELNQFIAEKLREIEAKINEYAESIGHTGETGGLFHIGSYTNSGFYISGENPEGKPIYLYDFVDYKDGEIEELKNNNYEEGEHERITTDSE